MTEEGTSEHRKNRYDQIGEFGVVSAWTFPAFLSVVILLSVWVVTGNLGLRTGPTGAALSARLAWATTAMLFSLLFAFTVGVCIVLMFNCGDKADAQRATIATSIVGVLAVGLCFYNDDAYWGPDSMLRLLNATAFCLGHVRPLTAVFDGFACWAALLVVATSCVIAKHEVKSPEALSRQLRGSQILMYTAAGLLIAGVSETSALHKWPAHDDLVAASCRGPLPLPSVARQELLSRTIELDEASNKPKPDANEIDVKRKAVATAQQSLEREHQVLEADVDVTATAISTAVGMLASLVLAAAYLPLALLLRQRAYRVIQPWERTEAWLGVHGFALQPTQQLSKVLLILSPMLAGGPVSYLITLLSR